MTEKITVLVADDHPLIRNGLTSALGAEPDVEVIGEARDGREAINKTLETKPDVVVMDIFMPGCSGLEALVAIKEKLPNARVLILTISERESDLLQAMKFGAQGYILKTATITEVVDAVRKVAAGQAPLSPSVATRLVAEFRRTRDETRLSSRETEVLQLLGEGLTSTEIASRLFISESTVRTYLFRLLEKLQLRNRAEVVAYAIRNCLIDKPLP